MFIKKQHSFETTTSHHGCIPEQMCLWSMNEEGLGELWLVSPGLHTSETGMAFPWRVDWES